MNAATRIRAWFQAIRLRTLPLALASILMGTFLAASNGQFSLSIFLLAITTTIFLQILSNLANDYGDSMHGVDSDHRQGPVRSVQSGIISRKSMKTAIFIVSLLSLLAGIALLAVSIENFNLTFLLFVGLGIGAILAALGYTIGKRPYGYEGLGDLFVLIFFGLIGVLGTAYLFSGHLFPAQVLPALSSGLFATAVLNINNIRDIRSDAMAGKRSIPVRIGRNNAVIYHWFLLSSGFILALIYTFLYLNSPYQFLFVITLPLLIRNGLDVRNKKGAKELDPSLRKMAFVSLLFTLLFGIGLLV